MNWLLIGGAGFVGTNLARYLRGKGEAVTIVDPETRTLSSKEWAYHGVSVNKHRIQELVRFQFREECPDVVVLLAAQTDVFKSTQDPVGTIGENTEILLSTLKVIETIPRPPVLVFISSAGVVGSNPGVAEEAPYNAQNPYTLSKVMGEMILMDPFQKVQSVVIRPSNIYGPHSGHKTSVVARFITPALSGEPGEIYGDGKQTRDFIHVEDVCIGIEKAAYWRMNSVQGGIFNVSSGKPISINDMASFIQLKTGATFKHLPERPGDIKEHWVNNTKAIRELGWFPQIGLEAGLSHTIRWFQDRGAK
jgi:UDP-glucose 4-epimerase